MTPSSRCGQRGNSGKFSVVFVSQAQRSRRDILPEVLDRGSPRDGHHYGRSPQKPSQCYLCGARTVCLGNLVKHFAGNFTCSEWIPRNKSNSIALTIIHYVVP